MFLRFNPYRHDRILQLLQICWLNIYESPIPAHPKDALLLD